MVGREESWRRPTCLPLQLLNAIARCQVGVRSAQRTICGLDNRKVAPTHHTSGEAIRLTSASESCAKISPHGKESFAIAPGEELRPNTLSDKRDAHSPAVVDIS